MANGIDSPPPDMAAARNKQIASIAERLVNLMLKLAVFTAIDKNPRAFGLDKNWSMFDALEVIRGEMNKRYAHNCVREWLEANLAPPAELMDDHSLTPDQWKDVASAMLCFLHPPAPFGPAN